jgi:hypothetical protein
LEIVLVNLWEGNDARAEALSYCELWGIDGPVLLDERNELAERLGIRGVPTNVLVDSDGTVTAVGAARPADLERATQRLLGDALLDPPASGAVRRELDAEHVEREISGRGRAPRS